MNNEKKITVEEIDKNIGFLETKGKLLKTLVKEKNETKNLRTNLKNFTIVKITPKKNSAIIINDNSTRYSIL